MAVGSIELSRKHFTHIRETLYRVCGIDLQAGKEELVKARLVKRVRALELAGFDDYLRYLDGDRSGKELKIMVDALTTNKTSFFREARHFEYIREMILPALRPKGGRMRFWSAGCSSGEEPYTLAMMLRESISGIDKLDVRILATDLSPTMVSTARQGRYARSLIGDIPPGYVKKYFARTDNDDELQVVDQVRSMINVGQLNLMDQWPMKGPFDVILCRNVMIYFDLPTKQKLIDKYWNLLGPGGHLFIGHSESLTGLSHRFRTVLPAAYVKESQ